MTCDHEYLARGDFVARAGNPIEIVAAQGASLFDRSGKRWIDLEAANGSLLLGYDHELTEEAFKAWVTLPTAPSFVETTYRRTYASRLGKLIEQSLRKKGKLAFELGGAQGIELALRIASLNLTQRRTIVVLDGCYHGRSLSVANLSSSYRYRESLPSNGFRVHRLPVPAMLAASGIPLQAAVGYCTEVARQLFLSETCGVSAGEKSDALAFLFEPVLNVAGLVNPTIDYLNAIMGFAKDVGCLTIADEIFTGGHRFGPFLVSERLSSAPDIVVLSKFLTNGYVPLSAVWARDRLADHMAFPPGTYSTTFANTPLHFIVGHKVLDRVESLDTAKIDRVHAFLRRFTDGMIRRLGNAIVDSDVAGMAAYIEFSSPIERRRVCDLLRNGAIADGNQCGVLCASSALNPRRIQFHPPIVISRDEETAATTCLEAL